MAKKKLRDGYEVPPEVMQAYSGNHLALGLGAGVSQGSKLPPWDELVRRVAGSIEGVGRSAANALLEDGFDPIAVATYLRTRVTRNEVFAENVRNALYRDFKLPPASKHNHRSFASAIRKANPTLHAVGTMCGIAEGNDKFAPNRKIRAILTLNVDCLLEEYTRARFKKRVLRTTERAAAGASSHRIHSYHVHGFLVRDTSSADLSKESPDRLVFTEQQYFDAVADANGFTNYTVLFLLREYRFLFIGLSMTDSNLRRSLHLSYRERVRELQAEGETPRKAHERACRHWALLKRGKTIPDEARERMLEALGVRVLWMRDHDSIPGILRAIYESDRDHQWSDVA